MRNSERSTFAAERLVKTTCGCDTACKNQPPQIETTLHVVDSIAIGLECRLIAKLGWPDVGIVWMKQHTSECQFRGHCAASPECLSPAADFATFVAALGKETLGRLCFLAFHISSLAAKEGRSLNPPRIENLSRRESCATALVGGWLLM